VTRSLPIEDPLAGATVLTASELFVLTVRRLLPVPDVELGFVTVRFHVPVVAVAPTETVAVSVVGFTTTDDPVITESPDPLVLLRERTAPLPNFVPATVTGTRRVCPPVPVRPTTAGTTEVTVGDPETTVKASESVSDLPPRELACETVRDRNPAVAVLATVIWAVRVVALTKETEEKLRPEPDAERASDERKFVPRMVADTVELAERTGWLTEMTVGSAGTIVTAPVNPAAEPPPLPGVIVRVRAPVAALLATENSIVIAVEDATVVE
jgi:hypothetical protein